MDCVLYRFADGRIVSPELVIAVREAAAPARPGWVAWGRQAPPGRPHDVRQRAPATMWQARVTRPWCGPGGYIQVGMRGCEPGGGIRAPPLSSFGREGGSVPLHLGGSFDWEGRGILLLSRLPPSGGRGAPLDPPGPGGALSPGGAVVLPTPSAWGRGKGVFVLGERGVVAFSHSLPDGGADCFHARGRPLRSQCALVAVGGLGLQGPPAPPSLESSGARSWLSGGLACGGPRLRWTHGGRAGLGALGGDANGRCGRVR